MKFWTAPLAFLFFAGLSHGALSTLQMNSQISSGNLKGHEQLSQELSARLFEVDSLFQLKSYLNSDDVLALVMGGIKFENGYSSFANPHMGPMGLLMYHVVFNQFATDLLTVCKSENPKVKDHSLNGSFTQALRPFCTWSAAPVTDAVLYHDLWKSLVGYELDPQEAEAWMIFALEDLKDQPTEIAVPQLLRAAFLNPQWLMDR